MMKKLLTLLFIAVIVCGCTKERKHEAALLNIEDADGYTLVTIADPWHSGKTLHSYVLVDRDKPVPDNLPEGTIIKVPLTKALVYSDVYARPIKELGCTDAVCAVLDAQYFKTPEIVAGLKSGKVADCGSSMSPSTERIVSAAPEAMFMSPMENSGYGALSNMGIPIIEMVDYMEASPLERAQWIEFIGRLFGKQQEAEAIYDKVKSEYTALKSQAAEAKSHPTVISEYVINGVWYVPGGKSYKAALYADAAASYPWADDKSSGSLSLDFPRVLDKAQNADFWLVTVYGQTLDSKSMLGLYPHNDKFRAFTSGGVYYVDSATSGLFEETPFHPERLLREYVKLFHPELLPDYKLTYYKPMGK